MAAEPPTGGPVGAAAASQATPPASWEALPEVGDGTVAEWAEWARTECFPVTRLRPGYDPEQVDAFLEAISDTFLGVRDPPLTPSEVRDKKFRTTRIEQGYGVEEVDAFLDEAECRLMAWQRRAMDDTD